MIQICVENLRDYIEWFIVLFLEIFGSVYSKKSKTTKNKAVSLLNQLDP